MPLPTPFHNRTAALCESYEWRDWSGFLAAATYEPTHEREYFAIRNAAALIDVSPLFKYDIIGREAQRLVNKIITRDVSSMAVGQIYYSPWCDEAGHMIDDGTIWRLGEEHFRLTAADPSLRWFQDCGFGFEAQVSDVSRNLAALALQGPNARAVLSQVVEEVDLTELKFYQLARGKMADFPVTVTRTGFTGDLGYELWVAAGNAEAMWDMLMEAGRPYGLMAAGTVALDIARIEAGLLLIEVDYISSFKAVIESRKSSPFEAGLGWTVSPAKARFVGQKALIAERETGSEWALVGLQIDWPELEKLFASYDLPPQVAGRASRAAVPLYNDKSRQVGQVTSSTFSPVSKRYIALATVESEFSKLGTELQVEITVEFTRRLCRANVVDRPFYNPPHKRS
jgi:aminomethyltransferase